MMMCSSFSDIEIDSLMTQTLIKAPSCVINIVDRYGFKHKCVFQHHQICSVKAQGHLISMEGLQKTKERDEKESHQVKWNEETMEANFSAKV